MNTNAPHPATALTSNAIATLVEGGYTSCMLDSSKQAWLKALRSGEYAQCRGSMTRTGSFCCLGVAAMLIPGAKVLTTQLTSSVRMERIILPSGQLEHALELPTNHPFAVYDLALSGWTTLSMPEERLEALPEATYKNTPLLGKYDAASWNDNQRKSFLAIADLIEKHVYGLPE